MVDAPRALGLYSKGIRVLIRTPFPLLANVKGAAAIKVVFPLALQIQRKGQESKYKGSGNLSEMAAEV